ncbi:MAG: DUF2344 domain-containing protein [Lachnospiraceae bacterium]|nr:DUF2344 domain-containing protein [Lachnospiraceae bacterium]
MNVRVKFAKYGAVKFIGHLDVMRYFQKANRRAELNIVYSQGFNPHQIMSFAAPLGVGLTSDGEYVDLELHEMDTPEEMIKRLNATMNEGFLITGFKELPDPLPNQRKETAMSLVAAADYLVSVKDGYEIVTKDGALSKEEFERLFGEFYAKEDITILKKTKKSEKEVDIKPFIYQADFTKESFYANNECKTEVADGTVHAQSYENGKKLYLKLATGSVTNLKPELVMEAFCQAIGAEFNEYAYQYHRMETYANIAYRGMTQAQITKATEENTLPPRKLVPLMDANL